MNNAQFVAPINLTPHEVRVRDSAGVDHVFPASGLLARVSMVTAPSTPLSDGTPTCVATFGAAHLPSDDEHAGRDSTGGYIVSTMFADAYRAQGGDIGPLFVPDSGPTAIRENGQIVAVRALIRR